MKTEESENIQQDRQQLQESSNLEIGIGMDKPMDRKELLSILIRSQLELAYIFTTDILQCTQILKKIIRKPLKGHKRAQKGRRASFANETQNSDFPSFFKSTNLLENTNF